MIKEIPTPGFGYIIIIIVLGKLQIMEGQTYLSEEMSRYLPEELPGGKSKRSIRNMTGGSYAKIIYQNYMLEQAVRMYALKKTKIPF